MRWVVVSALCAVMSCGEGTHRLVVEVRSDLAPGYEALAIDVALSESNALTQLLTAEDELFEPAFRFDANESAFEVEDGDYTLEATIQTPDGTLGRSVRVAVRGDTAVQILLFRSCIGVECSSSGAQACLAGQCVADDCVAGTESQCDGFERCTDDSACSELDSDCGRGRCLSNGACGVELDDALCSDEEFCSSGGGCAPIPTGEPSDSGMPDAGVEDAGVDAATDDAGRDAATDGAPPDASMGTRGFEDVAGGMFHTCAIRGGEVWCFGKGENGQLGNGTQPDEPASATLVSGIDDATAIACGSAHCCVQRPGGVSCWGSNGSGQCGAPVGGERVVPHDVPGLSDVVELAAGDANTCAVSSTGEVRCWGQSNRGQLGFIGADTHTPTPIADVDAQAISAGYEHICALVTGGGVKCWGSNADGALGIPFGTTESEVAVDASGAMDVIQLRAGLAFTMTLRSDGSVHTWGDDFVGVTSTSTPISGIADVTLIEAAGDFQCMVFDQDVFCRGDNARRQLGTDGPTTGTPAPVPGLSPVSMLGAGDGHMCAITTDSELLCWGDNSGGQIDAGEEGVHQLPRPMIIEGV